MSFLDRLFGRKPAQAPNRKERRSFFKGANGSRLLLDWIVAPMAADKELRSDIQKVRSRARDLARNNPIARQYLALVTSNVIGPTGIKLQAQVKRGNTVRNAVNQAIEAGWLDWSKSASTCGRFSLTQVAQLVARTVATDGECLVRLVNVPLSNNKHGFALQVIDTDQLDHDYNVPAGRGQNEVRLGVEFDAWQKPVAYHIFAAHPTDYDAKSRERERIPAGEILHIYDPERANQSRGVSWFNSVMVPLKMLDGYCEAELVAARTASAKMGWLKYTDAAAMQLEGEIPTGPLQYDASPGTIEMLPPGVEFQEWSPAHPTTAFESYTKGVLRQVASGLRVSYNALANDLEGVNYSSMRSGLLIERDTWRTLQQLFIERFYQPVFERWLENATLAGTVQLGGDYRVFAGQVKWVPRGWAWVDPLKDLQASVLAIEHGLVSRSEVVAETGGDFADVLERLAAEKELADDYGLVLGASANNILAAQQNAPVNADASATVPTETQQEGTP